MPMIDLLDAFDLANIDTKTTDDESVKFPSETLKFKKWRNFLME